MAKKKETRAQRKARNIRNEAKRRYAEGDRSSYVMKKHGNTQKETPYEKKYVNLTKAQRQSNKQKYGNETGYDPYRKSHTIKRSGLEFEPPRSFFDRGTVSSPVDPKSNYLANQAWRKQQNVNQWLDEREDRRNQMKARVKGGDSSLTPKSFREATHGYKDGLLGLNFGGDNILTYDPVKGENVRDKLRLGMSQDDDYYDYFAGEGGLRSLNPQMMDEINPAGSGSFVRNMITKGFGAPNYAAEGLASLTDPAREKLGDVFSEFKESDFVEDFKGLKDAPGEVLNMLNNIGGVDRQFTAPQEVTERYVNPAAQIDRMDNIFQEDEINSPERIFKLPLTDGKQRHTFQNIPFHPDAPWNQFGNYLIQDPQLGQYATQMANGGLASLNVDFNSDPNYQALKQTNNYMGGF